MTDDASGDGRDENGWGDDGPASEEYTVDVGTPSRSDSPADADEWTATTADDADRDRIPLDLSRDDESATEADDEEDDPYAPEPSSTPVEAGDPSLENAVFVVLGAVAMILVVLRVLSLPL